MESNNPIKSVKRKLRIPINIEQVKGCFKNIDITTIKFTTSGYANEYVKKFHNSNSPTISIIVDEMNDGKVMLGQMNACIMSDKIVDYDTLHKLGYEMDYICPFHFVVWRK